MKTADHKVNHIQISPNGNRIIFFHIWKNGKNRYMRLLSSDIEGNELFYLTGNNFVSHCCWKNNSEIIAFCEDPRDNVNKYMLVKDRTSEMVMFMKGILQCQDGHPSVSPNGEWLLIDTYPDSKTRMSSLMIYIGKTKV